MGHDTDFNLTFYPGGKECTYNFTLSFIGDFDFCFMFVDYFTLLNFSAHNTQTAFTYSKLRMETPEQSVKYVQSYY